MGDDMSPVMDARVSTGTESNPARDDALREFLLEHKHTSPFESMIMQVELKIPICILRQLERHRTVDNCDGIVIESLDENFRKWFSPNEQSGRYTEFKEEFYIPDIILGPDKVNKQGSSKELDQELQDSYKTVLLNKNIEEYAEYDQFIQKGVSKETARFLLSQNVYTIRRFTASFHNWKDLLEKRKTTNAQREAQQYAQSIYTIMQHLWPRSCQLLEEHVFGARHFCRTEVEWIKGILAGAGAKERIASLGSYSERRWTKFLAKLT
jgi:thymidylate synthase (FAD)